MPPVPAVPFSITWHTPAIRHFFGSFQLHTCGFNSVKEAPYIWPIREKKRPFIHAQKLDAMLKIADEMETLILALGSTLGLEVRR